ncbi:MAG TPA: NAD(P)-dependent oxidoreductase [Solirubrobacteraceae bacterium]
MLAQQTWVLTGAAGRIATSLRPALAARVRSLRLLDISHVAAEHPNEQAIDVDVRDRDVMAEAIAGADGVLHFGGLADEADFRDLADVNIVGTFNVLEASRRAGVGRFVYASSNRLTGFYPTSTTVTPDMIPRPDGLYGASKAACEALMHMYCDKFGLSAVSMRIGSFEDVPQDERQLSTWLSPGDCLAAVLAAMTASSVAYAAFYAVSDNTRCWWDLAPGHALGFHPVDDAELYAPGIAAARSPASAGAQGGPYASPNYTLRFLDSTPKAALSYTTIS